MAIIRVWAAYIRVWAAIIHVQAAYTPRMLGAIGVCTAHLQRTYCVMCALTCSKFYGARSARGVCLAHFGDATTYVWRTHSVNKDPRTYMWRIYRVSANFFRTPCIAGQWSRGIKEQRSFAIYCPERWRQIRIITGQNGTVIPATLFLMIKSLEPVNYYIAVAWLAPWLSS